MNYSDTGGPTCWNRIFQAFLLYRNTYRPDTLLNQPNQTSFAGSTSSASIKTIAPKEVTALIAVLNLIEVIAAQVRSDEKDLFPNLSSIGRSLSNWIFRTSSMANNRCFFRSIIMPNFFGFKSSITQYSISVY